MLSKDFGLIDSGLSSDDSAVSPKEIEIFIKRLFSIRELNKKINAMHKFFEISMISFNTIEEPIVKQLNASKKSGLKKNKTLLRRVTSFLE